MPLREETVAEALTQKSSDMATLYTSIPVNAKNLSDSSNPHANSCQSHVWKPMYIDVSSAYLLSKTRLFEPSADHEQEAAKWSQV